MNAAARPGRGPLTAVVAWLVALMIVIGLASLFVQRPVRVIEPAMFLGYDFGDFFCAASARLTGFDPYADCSWFISPPPSMLHAMLLHPLGQTVAVRVFLVLNVLMIAGAAIFLLRRLGAGRVTMGLALVAMALSQPFIFLVERGNTDGLVFLALVVALCAERGLIAGPALAFAVAIKVYPVLLGPVLLSRHRLPFVIGGAVVIIAMCLPVLDLWPSFVAPLLGRSNLMHVQDNVSFFALLFATASLTAPALWKPMMIGATVFYGALLVAALVVDWRLRERLSPPQRMMLVASWAVPMIAFPPLVYVYSAIVLFIPLLVAQACAAHIPTGPGTRRLLIIGLCLALAPSYGLYSATRNIVFHLMPSLGCLVLLVWFVRLRLDLLGAAVDVEAQHRQGAADPHHR